MRICEHTVSTGLCSALDLQPLHAPASRLKLAPYIAPCPRSAHFQLNHSAQTGVSHLTSPAVPASRLMLAPYIAPCPRSAHFQLNHSAQMGVSFSAHLQSLQAAQSWHHALHPVPDQLTFSLTTQLRRACPTHLTCSPCKPPEDGTLHCTLSQISSLSAQSRSSDGRVLCSSPAVPASRLKLAPRLHPAA
eukprot:1137008-Pelagomonas_calceolata.AAC.4